MIFDGLDGAWRGSLNGDRVRQGFDASRTWWRSASRRRSSATSGAWRGLGVRRRLGRFGWIAALFRRGDRDASRPLNARSATQTAFVEACEPVCRGSRRGLRRACLQYDEGGLCRFHPTGLAGLVLAFTITALAALLMSADSVPHFKTAPRASACAIALLLVAGRDRADRAGSPVVLFLMFAASRCRGDR